MKLKPTDLKALFSHMYQAKDGGCVLKVREQTRHGMRKCIDDVIAKMDAVEDFLANEGNIWTCDDGTEWVSVKRLREALNTEESER